MKFFPGSILYIGAAIFVLVAQVPAQIQQAQQSQGSQQQDRDPMSGMPSHEKAAGGPMDHAHHHAANNSEAAVSANQAMSEGHMDMGPHMYMTDLRPENPADAKRAAELAATLGKAIEKYKDYKVALADGFEIFHAEVPKSTITSRITVTRSKRRSPSIPNIPLRCCTGKRASATSSKAPCTPPAGWRRRTI